MAGHHRGRLRGRIRLLDALGAGLGFATIAPWPGHAISVKEFAITTAIWFIVMQWLSSGVGGYITGRLRTRWPGTHPHEVFFRDTAHGLITWAVATVVVSATLATSAFSLLGGGAQGVAELASGAAQGGVAAGTFATNSPATLYAVDKLFRAPPAADSPAAGSPAAGSPAAGSGQAGESSAGDPRGEAARIVANAWATGAVPDADRGYLAEKVAARTGVSPAEAQRRVDDFITSTLESLSKVKADATEAAKAAAEAAAQASIYTALAMLVGAFIASVSAALGGRLRDEHL